MKERIVAKLCAQWSIPESKMLLMAPSVAVLILQHIPFCYRALLNWSAVWCCLFLITKSVLTFIMAFCSDLFICPHSLLQDVDSAFRKHLFPFLKAIGRIVESRWNVAMQLNLMHFCFFRRSISEWFNSWGLWQLRNNQYVSIMSGCRRDLRDPHRSH